jgi:hypothetical protein
MAAHPALPRLVRVCAIHRLSGESCPSNSLSSVCKRESASVPGALPAGRPTGPLVFMPNSEYPR